VILLNGFTFQASALSLQNTLSFAISRPFGGQFTPSNTKAPSMAQDREANIAMDTVIPNKETGPDIADDVSDHKLDATLPSQDAQRGVQKIEAVTLAWTPLWLAALLFKYVSTIIMLFGCTHN
jgi:hypothetical protein